VDLLIIIVLVVLFITQLLLLFSGLPLHPPVLLVLLLPPGPISPLPLLIVLPLLHLLGMRSIPCCSSYIFGEWRVKIMDDTKVPL
jgi:hypothetical protein